MKIKGEKKKTHNSTEPEINKQEEHELGSSS